MKLTKNIFFNNFVQKRNNHLFKIIKKNLKFLLKENNQIINSLSKNYQYSFKKKTLNKFKKFKNFQVIGMGGSILGTEAIYDFLHNKINKNFKFTKNLQSNLNKSKKKN